MRTANSDLPIAEATVRAGIASGHIDLGELLRVIQLFNTGGYHCADPPESAEDGYNAGPGSNDGCPPHDSDYRPQDWRIDLSELLRLIQFFNTGGYYPCPEDGTEDGFCPGLP